MKFLKISYLLFFCLALEAVIVDTGHANVSLVKFESLEGDRSKTLLGIKMDMQENWHTYWKNPGDSGGPIKVKWSHDNNISISKIYWPTPTLIPYEPLMTYGYKNFVIFPFEIINSNNKNSYIEANIDFLICDDICVPEKALIKTNLDEIKSDPSLNDWFLKVPDQTLPVKASVNSEYINIRFSSPIDVSSAIFFVDEQDIVEHAENQKLSKEENNYLLSIKKVDYLESFENLSGLLSINNNDPKSASKPFDVSRDGFVMGEGAGALIFEEYNHAKNRNAKIFGEVIGGGQAADAYHLTGTNPSGEGAVLGMLEAIKEAKIKRSDIDYINMHATSTLQGDLSELFAINRVFGKRKSLSISGTKSMTGHLLGAAGAIEGIISLMALKNNIVPPTINTINIEPEYKNHYHYPLKKGFKKSIKYAMSNTFGFGGHISTIIFKK